MSDELIGPNPCTECFGEYGDHDPGCPNYPKRHQHFEIKTQSGNSAMILGDPNMSEATKKTLAEMIDAVVRMANTKAAP